MVPGMVSDGWLVGWGGEGVQLTTYMCVVVKISIGMHTNHTNGGHMHKYRVLTTSDKQNLKSDFR